MTSYPPDTTTTFKAAFEKKNPGVTVEMLKKKTTAGIKYLQETSSNNTSDMFWASAPDAFEVLKGDDLLDKYKVKVKGIPEMVGSFPINDPEGYYKGFAASGYGIMWNTRYLKAKKLPVPKEWSDLAKPIYKGSVVMPNPNSSGTGFLDVASWLQMFGEDDGWAFMDGLHENIAWYTHSGSKPCRQAGAGETPIGVSFAYRGAKVKSKGAPVEIIIPSEGIGWDMEATAIMKGTDKLEAAKKLVDFSVSKEANEMYNTVYAVVAYPGVAQPVEYYPEAVAGAMIDNDFEWVASNRMSILKEWQSRYDSKSEPKS